MSLGSQISLYSFIGKKLYFSQKKAGLLIIYHLILNELIEVRVFIGKRAKLSEVRVIRSENLNDSVKVAIASSQSLSSPTELSSSQGVSKSSRFKPVTFQWMRGMLGMTILVQYCDKNLSDSFIQLQNGDNKLGNSPNFHYNWII